MPFGIASADRTLTDISNILVSNTRTSIVGLSFTALNQSIRGRVQTTWTNEGRGVTQMDKTLNNGYLLKVFT